ncbi:hypothetical protein BRARA_H00288 [Brassica rapa]|uniref:DUF4283 domain-containing protein n=1 Tax=Brassica campestris TaxID=3711 RepID=A0A397Y7D8_BRACM|nr:hypothetical protein BRARA_H00288 [Brassica rapa]
MGKRKGPKLRSPPKEGRSTSGSASVPKVPPSDPPTPTGSVVVESDTESVAAGSPAPLKESTTLQLENEAPNGLEPQSKPAGGPVIAILKKSCDSYILPSGEACVKIPNSVIEKHRKSWDCFVIGQFYVDPPSQGTIHNIVNGIWSKQYRDIAVSKMEGFTYLFRIPNVSTRNHVINQRLWQIDGKTMFVAKWEPGVVPSKPELSEAPIWLELRQVPLQFFNEDGLERIASLVGDPKFLHPTTANKTNLEVAKVFTIIDPRKPLPEVVNVQFEAGKICRVLVSSPWMPPVCGHCKEIGHTSTKCKLALITCIPCNLTSHSPLTCPKTKSLEAKRRKTRRAKPKEKQWALVNPKHQDLPGLDSSVKSKLGTSSDFAIGECSKSHKNQLQPQEDNSKQKEAQADVSSGVDPDSSDVESSEEEEGEILEDDEENYRQVHNKSNSKYGDSRGEGPNLA